MIFLSDDNVREFNILLSNEGVWFSISDLEIIISYDDVGDRDPMPTNSAKSWRLHVTIVVIIFIFDGIFFMSFGLGHDQGWLADQLLSLGEHIGRALGVRNGRSGQTLNNMLLISILFFQCYVPTWET